MTFDVRKLTERFSVTPHTILSWISSGELQAINICRRRGGRPRWRITAESLAAFEAARASTPPAPPVRRRRQKSRAEDVLKFYDQ